MPKMIFAFLLLTLIIWGSFQIIPHIPKELWYTYGKKIISALVALVVASGIIFVFVQLF